MVRVDDGRVHMAVYGGLSKTFVECFECSYFRFTDYIFKIYFFNLIIMFDFSQWCKMVRFDD